LPCTEELLNLPFPALEVRHPAIFFYWGLIKLTLLLVRIRKQLSH